MVGMASCVTSRSCRALLTFSRLRQVLRLLKFLICLRVAVRQLLRIFTIGNNSEGLTFRLCIEVNSFLTIGNSRLPAAKQLATMLLMLMFIVSSIRVIVYLAWLPLPA